MAIEGFSPPPSPPPPSPPPSPPPPYYQLLKRGSARLGRVKKRPKKKTDLPAVTACLCQ